MIIAVTGYRGYTDAVFIRKELMIFNSLRVCSSYGPLHVRVGDADGADAITVLWCLDNDVSYHMFKAERYPGGALMPGAGPARNRRMLLGIGDHVPGPTDRLVGFPRTDRVRITVPGSGTWGCLIKAAELGIRVEIPPYRVSGVSGD